MRTRIKHQTCPASITVDGELTAIHRVGRCCPTRRAAVNVAVFHGERDCSPHNSSQLSSQKRSAVQMVGCLSFSKIRNSKFQYLYFTCSKIGEKDVQSVLQALSGTSSLFSLSLRAYDMYAYLQACRCTIFATF